MARKLIVALKGTGFSKVLIQLEDGTAVESEEGEDEETGDEAAAAGQGGAEASGADGTGARQRVRRRASAGQPRGALAGLPSWPAGQPQGAAAPSAQPAGNAQPAAGPDAARLTADLTALVRQMVAVIAADPSKKSALAELATNAQAEPEARRLAGGIGGHRCSSRGDEQWWR